jgi:Glyoxalase-like domain
MTAVRFHLSGITIDCLDPKVVSQFWANMLGGVARPEASLPGWYELEGHGHPRITFQPVPEPKTVKTRVHLDLTVDDIDIALAAVEEAGGRSTGERHDYREGIVVVMADPEGTEFCIVQYFDAK